MAGIFATIWGLMKGLAHILDARVVILGIVAALIGEPIVYKVIETKRLEDAFPNASAILSHIEDTAELVTHKRTYDIYVSTGIIAGFKGANSFSGDYRG